MAAAVLTSCDMDTAPKGVLTDQDGITNYIDCEAARNGVYAGMRSFGTGGYIYFTDLQMDMFIGTETNGNRNGELARGEVYSDNQDIEAVWSGVYSRIGNINYFITQAEALLESGTLENASRVANVKGFIAEAKFARAMYYLYLFDHFCQAYTADKATTPALGLPLVDKYQPTPDRKSYAPRSTMAKTFEFIEEDLTEAYDGLVEWEQAGHNVAAANSAYVSSYTVEALWARAALLKRDFDTAIEKAQNVIDAGIWTLTPYGQYAALWASDQGTELIFRPFFPNLVNTEQGAIASTGDAWLNSNGKESDYIPSYMNCLTMYDRTTVAVGGQNRYKDVRVGTFFTQWNLKYQGTTSPAMVFTKYPGNAIFNSGRQEYKNMPKLFRLSELYLIVAEASYENNDEGTANTYLADLRTQRILGYDSSEEYSGTELRDEIRLERTRELIGEGFRMSDLRRWGLGFQRNPSYPISPTLSRLFRRPEATLQYAPNYYRFVWPIPQAEMDVNPQLKGQQNPGY